MAAEGRGRLAGKTAVVVGAGQTPGETVGNGRAMALLFAREGARVLCVDRIGERPRRPPPWSAPKAATPPRSRPT